MARNRQVGQILVELGYITQEQLVRAVMEQKDTGERLGSILTRRGYITPDQLTEALALQAGVDYVQFSVADVQAEALAEIPPAIARHLQILPLRIESDRLVVAPLDINNADSLQELYRVVRRPVSLVCANPVLIEAALRLYYPESASDIDLAADYPCVQEFVENLIQDALSHSAEAVHIEPQDANTVAVRYRTDGRLETVRTVTASYARVAIHRMKKMTGMSPADAQAHFSGLIPLTAPDATVQLSCVQTSRGERAVVRFFRHTSSDPLTEGMPADSADVLLHMLATRSGLVVVSGEDVTACQAVLSAVLRHKAQEGVSVFSLDPLVAQGVVGVHTLTDAGDWQTSSGALRAVLEQDPDVVVAGVVESASPVQMLVSSALSGVWVALAIRAEGVPSALIRLQDFGVAPALLTGTLTGIVQVYTLPRLCDACRTSRQTALPDWLADAPGEAVVYSAAGCERCRHTGYSGTTNVIEVFEPDAHLRELLVAGAGSEQVGEMTRSRLQPALRSALREKVLSGQVSLQHAQMLWERHYPPPERFLSLAA